MPLIVLLSLVCYRITRFLIDDSLIDEPRWWVQDKLKGDKTEIDRAGWRNKLLEFMSCVYCESIWVSAGLVVIADQFTSVPLPWMTWLAVSGACAGWWRLIETPHD